MARGRFRGGIVIIVMVHCELLIDGHFIGGPCDQAVGKSLIRNPYNRDVVGTAAEGDFNELRVAIQSADDAYRTWKLSTNEDRRKLLQRIADRVKEDRQYLSNLLTDEVGKPIIWSRGEVDRLAITFELAAREMESWGPTPVSLEIDPRGVDYEAQYIREPIGVIFGIVPYNWPFNLAAHKLAPAIASGNSIVLKPSPLAPLSTLALGRIIHECGCPPGVVNIVTASSQATEKALADPRIKMLSFTGSAKVGWHLKKLMFDRRVTLELGGDASAIVCDDADLEWALPRIIAGAFGYAGQICISIQHLLVHEAIYATVKERLVDMVSNCPTGDPRLEQTICGPMIDLENAERVESWIAEAVAMGAAILTGGKREGTLVYPCLLENVPFESKAGSSEVFGPVLTLGPFSDLSEAIHRVNRSQYGIHCGIFTKSDPDKAVRDLEVGGVVVNDYPTLRFDALPYGGVKHSGVGREGVRFAMEEMTQLKSIVRKLPAQDRNFDTGKGPNR